MAWHQFTVVSDEQAASRIADYFSGLGAVSVTYMDAEDEPVYEPGIGETKIWSHTQVIALFELEMAEPDAIKQDVLNHFQHQALHWQYDYVDDQLWERAWMDYYQPMKFSDKLWVCPTGQEQHEPNTVCLLLDPGLAFGTGTHPTTALCLEWLASHNLTGKVVIDYGCGSGILAVAAVLLGAKVAYAVDIDPQAITATYNNAKKNQVQGKIFCYLPEHFPVMKADIVLANILAKPLIDMSGSIANLLVPGGDLVLSGILAEQADSVRDAYQQQAIAMDIRIQQEDWIRLSGVRES